MDELLYTTFYANVSASGGLCNVVTTDDLFGAAGGSSDGALANNGTFSVGCGMGACAGSLPALVC